MIRDSILDELLLVQKVGSFSKAAEKLEITQPALSLRIKKIEKELGYEIFNRGAEVTLTPAGEQLLRYINKRKMLDADLFSRLGELEEGTIGALSIGSTHGFALGYLPAYMARMSEEYPGIDMKLLEMSMMEIEQLALSGDVDIFLTCDEADNEFEKIELFEENIFLCLPDTYKTRKNLAGKFITEDMLYAAPIGKGKFPITDICQLSEEKFIVLPENTNLGMIAQRMLSGIDNLNENQLIYTNQMTAGVAMTKNELGISFVTEDYLRYADFKKFPNILMIGGVESNRKVYAAYVKNRYLSNAAKIFLGILREMI